MTKLEHEHSAEAIHERISSMRHSYVRDWIYGGIDGAVTTFAVVSGVQGAELAPLIIIILGFANLFADGFSMAASNFLGTRAEHDDFRRLAEIERRHIELEPEGEREEVRQIFARKGFAGNDLDRAVELITSDKERWVQTMLSDEYGLPTEIRSAWKAAACTFISFLLCGLVPLVPYLFKTANSFTLSAIATGITFFLIGSFRSRWSTSSWLRCGTETFIVGALAAGLAYGVGVLLKGIAG